MVAESLHFDAKVYLHMVPTIYSCYADVVIYNSYILIRHNKRHTRNSDLFIIDFKYHNSFQLNYCNKLKMAIMLTLVTNEAHNVFQTCYVIICY